jgi:hypothetical protein
MQDEPKAGVTAANLSQLPSLFQPETRGKRKYSVGSSVATNGSIRSNLNDIDLTFDDAEPIRGDDFMGQQRPENSSRFPTLGDAVDSPTVSQTEGPRGNNEREEKQVRREGQDTETASMSDKPPEMSERKGGVTPFLARPGSSAQNPIDLMDLDTEQDTMQS